MPPELTKASRHWTETDIPDLHAGRRSVPGASTGHGFEVAGMLAGHGATVIMACRNAARAETAADRIRDTAPGARVRTMPLGLASLASVRQAVARLRAEYPRLDLLVNNTGEINPRYRRTGDGFETTLAANHLGPFAFTGLILDLLLAAGQPPPSQTRPTTRRGPRSLPPRVTSPSSAPDLLLEPEKGKL
jgi:NAD(P)-dependent dehydrogenase (short-subunit alcohol dehydrogenase family)